MDAARSVETLISYRNTTWLHNLENLDLHVWVVSDFANVLFI